MGRRLKDRISITLVAEGLEASCSRKGKRVGFDARWFEDHLQALAASSTSMGSVEPKKAR